MKIQIARKNDRWKTYQFDDGPAPITLSDRLVDLRRVANALFYAENVLTENTDVAKLKIPLNNSYSDDVEIELENMLFFMFGKVIHVELSSEEQRKLGPLPLHHDEGDAACLFSGGIDSFAGFLSSLNIFGRVAPVYSWHKNNTEQFLRNLYRKTGYTVYDKPFIFTNQRHKSRPMKSRGLLYVADALCVNSNKIIIGECGVTMHQPKFSPFDNVTLTTHPFLMLTMQNVTEHMLGQRPAFLMPNEDMTKAEIIASLPEKQKTVVKYTHSCRNTQFCTARSLKKRHCGVCYGCVIRKLGMEVTGIKENHRINIFGRTGGSLYSILPLLRFSMDVLTDYESLPPYTRKIIDDYGKRDLFRRFALDNFAGLMQIDRAGHLKNKILKDWLEMAESNLSKEVLDARIEEVVSAIKRPVF